MTRIASIEVTATAVPKPAVIHFAGPPVTASRDIGPGYAACCYGDRAEEIRRKGTHSRDRRGVTCKLCLRVIAQDVRK